MDAVLTIRVGAMGSGKTYGTVHDLIYKYAVDRPGPIIHNLPLNHGKICELARVDGLADRLIKIPDEVIASWKTRGNGPWSFSSENFLPAELAGGMFLLDEVHHCMGGQRFKADHNQHWLEWLSMVRHEQCEVVLITQTFNNFPKWVRDLCELKVEVGSVFGKRLPWFFGSITVGDLRQLWAGVLRTKLTTGAWLLEYRRVGSRWNLSEQRPMTFKQKVFEAYESHSATEKGTGGAERIPEPCERLGRIGIIVWFLRRNWFRMFAPMGLIGAFALMLSFVWFNAQPGGQKHMVTWLMNFVKSMKAKPKEDSAEVVVPPVAEYKPASTRIRDIEKIEGLEVKQITSATTGSEVSLPVAFVKQDEWKPPVIVGISNGRLIDEQGEEWREGDVHEGVALAHVGEVRWSWSGHPPERLRRIRQIVPESDAISSEGQSPFTAGDRREGGYRGADGLREMGERSGVGRGSGTVESGSGVNRGLGSGGVQPRDDGRFGPTARGPVSGGQVR